MKSIFWAQLFLIEERALTFIILWNLKNKIYSGTATAGPGQYKVGDILQVAYLPKDPSQMTVIGVNVHVPVLIITTLLFLFMVFATYKMGEMLNEGI